MLLAKRVLIVDDSELVLTMARDALEKQGYEVHTASSGIEANRIIFTPGKKPDLILLDLMMPMLNGDKVYEFFKQSELSRDIPVAIISSVNEEELKELVKKTGACGYIKKPFKPLELAREVKKFLGD